MQAAFVLWLAAVAPAFGATITVNTTDDELGADNRCSLREAISAANNDSAPFAGAGECAAGDASDTVALPAGMFKLSIGGPPDDTNAAGDLDILGTQVAIAGAGASATTIDADHIDRALDVRPGRIATIQGVTITDGRVPNGSNGPSVVGGTGGNGGDGADGGGIRNAGTLTVLDATVSGNAAGAGGTGGNGQGGAGTTANSGTDAGDGTGGQGGDGGAGGGIFNSGALVLTRVRVTNNVAGAGGSGGAGTGGQGGAAIVASGGTGGDGRGGAGGAGGAGGGVAETGGGTLAIDESSISVNAAGAGGAGGLGQGGSGGLSGGNPGSGGFAGAGVGGAGGAGGAGAGISASDAATVTNVLIESNTAGAGGAGGNGTGGSGGAVVGSSGTARSGSLGQSGGGGNGGSGGGIAATSAAATNVTITANATGPGGAAGSATGGAGGGVAVSGSAGNGGFANAGDGGGDGGSGGGLESVGTSTIRHATITSNSLGTGGAAGLATGGAAGAGGTPGASGGVFQGSAGLPGAGGGGRGGGTATLQNSIVAGNAAPSCVGVTDGGHDISFPDAACPGANVDPKLAALADNGGPTKTQALESGSPALDAVPMSGAGCAITDQRRVARPQGANCDIGAYEHAPPGVATGDADAVSSAAATLRGQLNPNARVSSYHFELGTTTAYGTSTASQTTGAGVSPEAVAAAVSGLAPRTTYHFRLVATNADGTTAGEDRTFTTQAPSDNKAPRFLAAALARKVFAVDPRGRAEAPVAARAKRGTTFRYRLSEAARVVFTIGRALPGRRVGRACRKRTARNRTRRPCTRYVRVGRFAATASARANRKRFSGRIARRALKPGRYRASLVATDAAGNASPPKRLAFRVVRR